MYDFPPLYIHITYVPRHHSVIAAAAGNPPGNWIGADSNGFVKVIIVVPRGGWSKEREDWMDGLIAG